jgi:hypothetical protein
MTQYELNFITQPINEDIEDALLDQGCFVERHGSLTIVSLDSRAADSYRASLDAARKLERLGVHVERLDLDLLNKSQIADRAGVSKQAVQAWVDKPDFPEPHTASSGLLWTWGDIASWLRDTRGYDGEMAPNAREVAYFNRIWECESSLVATVPTVTTWASVLGAGTTRPDFAWKVFTDLHIAYDATLKDA